MELAPLLERSWSGAHRKFLELELSWSEKMSDGYYELRFFLLHLRSLQRELSVLNEYNSWSVKERKKPKFSNEITTFYFCWSGAGAERLENFWS